MGTKRTRDKKVGLFLIDNGSRYQKLLKREAERAARRHGLALDTVLSDNFAAQQSQDIMRFVHANLDRQVGVVAMTVSDSASSEGVSEDPVYRLARRVAVRGAGWVILNRDTEAQIHALRQEFPRVPIGMVTPDQKELGRIQGRQFRALLPRGGRVLYVLGMPHISSAQDRRTGMLEEVATAPIQVDEVDGLWSAEKAREAVYKWLLSAQWRRQGWPDVVGCQNDEMALGAGEALTRAAEELSVPALRKVPVTGVDGLADGGQSLVAERKLTATIVVPSTTGCAIDLLAEAWDSDRPTPSKTVLPALSYPPLDSLVPAQRSSPN